MGAPAPTPRHSGRRSKEPGQARWQEQEVLSEVNIKMFRNVEDNIDIVQFKVEERQRRQPTLSRHIKLVSVMLGT